MSKAIPFQTRPVTLLKIDSRSGHIKHRRYLHPRGWWYTTAQTQTCCGVTHPLGWQAEDGSGATEVQATPDGGCVVELRRNYHDQPNGQPAIPSCNSALIKVGPCGCPEWERHYGPIHDPAPSGGIQSHLSLIGTEAHFANTNYGRLAVGAGGTIFAEVHDDRVTSPGGVDAGPRRLIDRYDPEGTPLGRDQITIGTGYPLGNAFAIGSDDVILEWLGGLGAFIFNGPAFARWDNAGNRLWQRVGTSPSHELTYAFFPTIEDSPFNPTWLTINDCGQEGAVRLIGTRGSDLITTEIIGDARWTSTTPGNWQGMGLRSSGSVAEVSRVDTPTILGTGGVVAEYWSHPANGDPACIAHEATGTFGHGGVHAASGTYTMACSDPAGNIYAYGTHESFGGRTGVIKLTVSGSLITPVWLAPGPSDPQNIIQITPRRLVADATGVYGVGVLWRQIVSGEATYDTTWGIFKLSPTDGRILWALPCQATSLCLATDGDLYVCCADPSA